MAPSEIPASENQEITLVRRQPLDSEGNCPKCSKHCDEDYMLCFLCDELYHVINCDGHSNHVTPTFYRGWANMIANYPNIQYICESCRIDKNMKKDVLKCMLCVMY